MFDFNFSKFKKKDINVVGRILSFDSITKQPGMGYTPPKFNNKFNNKTVKKPIIYVDNKHNAPPKKVVKQVYSRLPDDEKAPVVFQSKESYLREYIKNQEKLKGIKFSQQEKQQYMNSELKRMAPIQSRFTTYHNEFIEPRVVFFTDKKISPKNFRYNAHHEFAHELAERKPETAKVWQDTTSVNKSPTWYGKTDSSEDYAESFALYKQNKLRDPVRLSLMKKFDVALSRDLTSANLAAEMGSFYELGVSENNPVMNPGLISGRPVNTDTTSQNKEYNYVGGENMFGYNLVKKKDLTKDTVSKLLATNNLNLGKVHFGMGAGNFSNLGLRGNSLAAVGQGFNVFNKLKQDTRSRDSLLRYAGEERRAGKGYIKYTTPEGTPVLFQTSKKVKFGHLPHLDDVGYILDTLPRGAVPKGVEVHVVPRHYQEGRAPAKMRTAAQYFANEKVIRLYPFKQDPFDQDKIIELANKYKINKKRATALFYKWKNENPDKYAQSKQVYNAKLAQRKFGAYRENVLHELGHAHEYTRGLEPKWEAAGLKREEALVKYGRHKKHGEDISTAFPLWMGIQPAEHLPYSKPTDRPWEERKAERFKFFETNLSDIDPRKVVNVREDVEAQVTPFAFIAETKQPLQPELVEYAREKTLRDLPDVQRAYPEENVYRLSLKEEKEEKEKREPTDEEIDLSELEEEED